MSGAVKSNVFGSSGTVAAAAGGLSWQDVVTASTVTVESNRGYFINTTSNACTVTLPASPDVGDQVILLDYARTWDTNAITIDSNGNDFQNQADTYTVDYDTEGQGINIVFSGSTNGWIPNSDIANAFDHTAPPTQNGIFGFGFTSDYVGMTNLVNSSGVVAADVSAVGTAREGLSALNYGGDKAIFAYGSVSDGAGGGANVSMSNLVNNSGVVASDVTGVGTARTNIMAAGYGADKAIFAYGLTDSAVSLKNLCSNTGTIAADVSGVGTARYLGAAAVYGIDKAVFAYGTTGSLVSLKNLVNNLGVVAADVTGVGTARDDLAAARYGNDKAIFGFGDTGSVTGVTNLVSNTGVIAADVSAVGTARKNLAAAGYDTDKALFAFGNTGSFVNTRNLVNNSGVVASDATGAGTARRDLAAAGYSLSA